MRGDPSLGSVLYIVSISFLIIYGIILPNHPDPDDFTLSTGNMSEVHKKSAGTLKAKI